MDPGYDLQPPFDVPAYVNISTAALQNLSLLAAEAEAAQSFVSFYPTYVYGRLMVVTMLTAFVALFTVLAAVAAYVLWWVQLTTS
ncbi:hypothetical protein OH76DRAFT_1488951 [Lentinus brumalis]|uniref:Uncharacterized protein n=1 Tax=Lentinus brumalis TaxID=2498619 RepID=A0A371CP85_9APHY|nr:hypothetical protein OH76DRAFT_1488951 [Polyporus brumalis]